MRKTLLLHNDISEVTKLAEWVELIGEQLSLSATVVFQLNLALEEAVVNVMTYAYPGEDGRPVRLSVDVGEDVSCLVFALEDDGVPFDPTAAEDPDLTLPAEEREVGGLGIFLVKQFMTDVAYRREDDTNILTMTYVLCQ